MNMNPAAVASARTARLVREAATPVYSTETGKPTRFQVQRERERAEFQARTAKMREQGICTCDDC